jgi:hypothetical protein
MAGTQFGIAPKQIASLDYTGADFALTPVVEAARAPTVNDKNYPIDCFWRNNATRELWWLSGFDSTGALWIPFTSGSSGPVTKFPVPNGTTPVVPDGAGNVTLTSSLGTVTITGGTNAINFDLTGGAVAVEKIQGDDGVNVVPTAGIIKTFGSTVQNATHAKPVFFLRKSATTDTEELDVQVATTSISGSKNINNAGLASFDSARFNVDAPTGFITTNGSGIVQWNTIAAGLTLAVNNGYICTGGGALSLALPAVSVLGDIIEIALNGSTSWTITQAAGQQIRWSGSTTTLGATGTLATTGTGDTIRMVCMTANLIWVGLGGNGNLTVT